VVGTKAICCGRGSVGTGGGKGSSSWCNNDGTTTTVVVVVVVESFLGILMDAHPESMVKIVNSRSVNPS
jgi:hypothetical protein